MITSIKARLNLSRPSKKGLYPLGIQILGGGKKRVIPLGIALRREWFDSLNERIIYLPAKQGGNQHLKELNAKIISLREKIQSIASFPEAVREDYTADHLVQMWQQQQNYSCLFTFLSQHCEQLRKESRFCTAAQYEALMHSLKCFIKFEKGNINLLFKDITVKFCLHYRNYLEKRGIKRSSISTYLSLLRSVWNKARFLGIVSLSENNPFLYLFPRHEFTRKRAVGVFVLRKLVEADFDDSPVLSRVRDLFMASIYMRGMPLRDIMNLKRENLSDGILIYRRSKTGCLLQLKITPELQIILDRYENPDDTHLFPFLLSDTKNTYKDYRSALRRVNRQLHQISCRLQLSEKLTFYVARHSWATLARDLDTPLEKISQAMGHTSVKTTEIYLKSFSPKEIDNINEQVIGYLQKGDSFLLKKRQII